MSSRAGVQSLCELLSSAIVYSAPNAQFVLSCGALDALLSLIPGSTMAHKIDGFSTLPYGVRQGVARLLSAFAAQAPAAVAGVPFLIVMVLRAMEAGAEYEQEWATRCFNSILEWSLANSSGLSKPWQKELVRPLSN